MKITPTPDGFEIIVNGKPRLFPTLSQAVNYCKDHGITVYL